MRTMLCALALLLGVGMAAAPARAQDHPQDHAAMMAEHQRALGLTPEQMQRMEAIHARLAAAMQAHCARVRAAGGPNAQTHAAMHAEMQAAMESAHREMMALLTPAQQAKMDSLHAEHHGEGGHDMSAMHAGHGEHAMPHDSAGMAKMHEEMMHGMACPEGCTPEQCAACCAPPAPAATAPPRG